MLAGFFTTFMIFPFMAEKYIVGYFITKELAENVEANFKF